MPSPGKQHENITHIHKLQDRLCLEPKGEGDVSLGALASIKEEEMDTEQDGNMKIKMSGKKMREEYTMTDKKSDEGTQQQIIS